MLTIEPVAQRVQLSEYDLPESKIRSRWNLTHDALNQMMSEVDDVIVFSNDGLQPVPVGERLDVDSPFKLYLPDELPEVTRRLGLEAE